MYLSMRKLIDKINFRKANISDAETYFNWANDVLVREQSYHSEPILWEDHLTWFSEKLKDSTCFFYLFSNVEVQHVGQVRIQLIEELKAEIGVSIDPLFRGQGYGVPMLIKATDDFFKLKPQAEISAYIKYTNSASKFIFEKANFEFLETSTYNNFKSYHYIKKCK